MQQRNRSSSPDSRSAERIRRASLELFEEQQDSAVVPVGQDKRAEERYSAYNLGQVRLVHGQWSPDSPGLVVQVRDLSRHGLGVLHLNFVHVGAEMSVGLPTRSGGVEPVSAKVMRCVYLRKGLHEVGLKFDEPLDPAKFLIEAEKSSATPKRFTGKVLWVSANRESRTVARVLLERVGVEMLAANDADDAADRVRDVPVSGVVFDPGSDPASACEGLKALREAGFDGKAAAVLDLLLPEDEEALTAGGFAQVIERPSKEAEVCAMLADLLPAGEGGLVSSLWSDESLRPAVTEFVTSLGDRVEAMRGVAEGAAGQELVALAVDLMRSAGSMGLDPIAQASKKLALLARGAEADASALGAEVDAIAKLAQSASVALDGGGGA
ncbi:MAG: PilZ domain-containing protein [Planctomycetota bacterium]